MRYETSSDSVEASIELGRRIGAALPDKAIVLLEGEMGAGKTAFTKGIYRGRGGADDRGVVSPSYTIVNRYDELSTPFWHVDLYRLEEPRALLGLEYEDFLYGESGTTVVEWPRETRSLVDATEVLQIEIRPGDAPERRRISVEATGPRYKDVFLELLRPC